MTVTNKDAIRIIIIEDHKIVSQGIEMIVKNSGLANIVGKGYSIKDCFELLKKNETDILLLDLIMNDGNALDYIGKIKELYPELKILLISQMNETAVIKRALNSGASGFIMKSSTAEEIIDGIMAVNEGESYLCNNAKELFNKKDKIYENLTPREREILKLIVDGKTMKEIADELHLGFETVRSYCKYIRLKMNANNIASLVKTAIEQGLV